MESRPTLIYAFGEYSLKCEDGTLWRGEERIAITQKTVEMLTLLLENRGRVVTRDEIIEKLWPDTYVDENNLSVTVSMLRKAFGESGDAPQFIETIPRKGYRFNAKASVSETGIVFAESEYTRTVIERTEIDDEGATQAIAQLQTSSGRQYLLLFAVFAGLLLVAGVLAWTYTGRRQANILTKVTSRSIAILPFRDLSQDENGKQFSIGLADSLITKLAGIRGMAVRPMSAVMPLTDEAPTAKAVGQKLNVDAVLEGTIQRDGENYRVSVQLVNTKDDQVIWANVLEDRSSNLFNFQKLLSSQVADALAFKLSGEERNRLTHQSTENAEAYREYLLGRFFLNKRTSDDLKSSLPHFEKAIVLDPAYAEPHAAMAATYMLLSDSGYAALPPAEGYPKAKSEALKTLELDETVAEAYAVLGNVQTSHGWDPVEGERSLRKAIELNPSYATAYQWLGWALIAQRRTSEAEDALTRASELDPTSLVIAADQGYPAFFAGNYERAESLFRNALAMDRNYPASMFNLWRALLYGGKYEGASAELDAIEGLGLKDEPILLMARGCTFARLGKIKDAREIYEKLRSRQRAGEFITPNFTATLAAEIGESNDVFADFDIFVRDHNDYTPFLKFAPEFEKYRTDPRFTDLMKRAGLQS